MVSPPPFSTTTSGRSSRRAECSRATRWGPSTSAAVLALNPVYNKWYMDDGGIIGDVELLQKVWKLLLERGPEMGLELNPSKCEWSWLDPSCKAPCPIRLEGVPEKDQVKLVPHDKIEMLGVPLGSKDFTSDYVKEDLLTRLMPPVTCARAWGRCDHPTVGLSR